MKFDPHPYQAHCTDQIIKLPALALWLDMGLGKSVITLTAVSQLKYDYLQVRKCLIIAPKKVAEATWQNEAQKWDHLRHLRIATILGSQQQRLRALASTADVYIINRDNVQWLVDYYQHDWPFDMVVLDESSSFKNWQAKRWKKLKAVRPRISRLLELTGTPSPRDLIDLWAQIYLLDCGERLGKTIGSFRERYFDPDKRNATTIFTYKPKNGTEEAVKSLLADICISMKAEDYISLPDMLEDDIPVVLDPAAAKAYGKLEHDLLLPLADGEEIAAPTAATLTNKLLQLCNGAIYDADHAVHEIHQCKIDAFMELIEQLRGQHALVFYNYQHDRDRILQALTSSGLNVRAFSTPADADDWNAGKIDILLAHPASCAYGLNLQQGGHHIIWFGLNWSLELVQQANARLHRQGQQEPVIVHRLVVQGGVDEDVVNALRNKDQVQEKLLQSLKARIERIKSK